ncbi:MAG: tetratricopeptide repeat protein, partial [Spirochaetaceae bacterium]|nr:tetratricopeptide repeat protein [Spirochaetaceae bacterium]
FEAYLDTAFAGTGDIGLPLWEFIERGIAFLEDDKYDSALAEFNKALELKPDYAAALYFIGDVYFFQDKYDTAIEYYTRTLNIDPIPNADANYWDAYLARGICYLEKNDYDRAIADFNQSEKLRPKGAFMFYKRGLAYFNKKLYTSATKDFTKSIGLNSKNAEPYIYRGMVRILLKEYDKAVQDFSQGLKIEPTIAYVYYLRALAYSKKKYTKSAIADCEKALEIQYDLTEASELLATLRWTPPPKPPKPPKPPVKLEIDKGFHWYSAVGLVKNMESESDEYSELKYPAIGGSLMAGVSWYYLGVQSSVDFFNWFQGGFSIVGLFTLGLPLKISEFGIKPYAGIGSDVSSIVPDDSKYSSPDDFAGAVGVCFEVGIQVSIKRFFLSAAYRQRISSAEIKYRIKHSGQNYAIWEDFTKELFFNRLTVSIGVGY